MAESLFAGTLIRHSNLDRGLSGRHAPNIEFYATDGRGYSIENRNTRVIVMLMRLSPRASNLSPS